MRVETNLRLARRNRQLAQYLFFASFGLLILGLLISNVQVGAQDAGGVLALILPAIVLPLAFISTIVSVRMTNLWVRTPRPEDAIGESLKGISNKSVLYSYYLFPARHLLIAPFGVFVMITRFQEGRFTVTGDRWSTQRSAISRIFSLFRFDSIGNPSEEVRRAAEQVQKLFAQVGAPDVSVQPLIVFLDPRVVVVTVDPAIPVLYVDDRAPNLKDYIRDAAKKTKSTLTPEQIDAFEALIDPPAA
jgi:hypothetical protein